MAKSNKVVPKKRRGRPATGRDPVTAIRLSKELRETVDAWAAMQDDQPGRSQAMRRLVEIGLVASVPTSKQATKMAWSKKTTERWAERMTDLGWRQRFDDLLRAAMRGSMQPQSFDGLPIQGELRGEDYVKQEAWELFGIKWTKPKGKP